jgi:hypothetical protein
VLDRACLCLCEVHTAECSNLLQIAQVSQDGWVGRTLVIPPHQQQLMRVQFQGARAALKSASQACQQHSCEAQAAKAAQEPEAAAAPAAPEQRKPVQEAQAPAS